MPSHICRSMVFLLLFIFPVGFLYGQEVLLNGLGHSQNAVEDPNTHDLIFNRRIEQKAGPMLDIRAFGATGDGGAENTTGSMAKGSTVLNVLNSAGFRVGMGVHVDGAGKDGDVLLATIEQIGGTMLTLSVPAGTSVAKAAVGDDDTLAIQGAMLAYCAAGDSGGGSILFSPGSYVFSQPQSVNPNAYPFVPPCSAIHFLGTNGKFHGAPFTQGDQVTVTGHCGPSPNGKAAFQVDYPNGGGTLFENLIINGCNQAVEVQANNVTFRNTYLQAGRTGLSKNAVVWVWDNFWVYWSGGGITSSGTTAIPVLLFTGESCPGCYAGAGQFYMENAILSGGPIQYIQNGPQNGAPPGSFVFRDVQHESGNGDIFQISDPGHYQFYSLGSVTLDNFVVSDNASDDVALISYDIPNTTLTGVYIEHSSAPHAIRLGAGSKLDRYFITGCDANCYATASVVTDGTGGAVGSGFSQTRSGIDLTEDGNSALGGQLESIPYYEYSPAVRVTQSGAKSASVALGASLGLGFGNPTVTGFNAQLYQPNPLTSSTLAIAFAANYPPTHVDAAVVNGGGTFAAGIYYLYMVSTLTASCSGPANFSAPSNIVGPLNVTGRGRFTVTWSPSDRGVQPIAGYCIFVGVDKTYNPSNFSTEFIGGATTRSTTVAAVPVGTGGTLPITYKMISRHTFSPDGAVFNGDATPGAPTDGPLYPNPCLAAGTCGAQMALSPWTSDSFERPNASTLGMNWSATESGGTAAANLVLMGKTVTAAASNTVGTETWTGQSFLPDQFSRATITALANGTADSDAVIVRGTGKTARTNYGFVCKNNVSLILKYTSGVATTLSTGEKCAPGDVLELDVVGSNPTYLTALLNERLAAVAKDSSSPILNGQPGIEVWNSSDALSNWVGGSLPPGNADRSIFSQPNTWSAPQIMPSVSTTGMPSITGSPSTCRRAPSGKAQLCFDSFLNRPEYSYNGSSMKNVLLAGDFIAGPGISITPNADGTFTISLLRKAPHAKEARIGIRSPEEKYAGSKNIQTNRSRKINPSVCNGPYRTVSCTISRTHYVQRPSRSELVVTGVRIAGLSSP